MYITHWGSLLQGLPAIGNYACMRLSNAGPTVGPVTMQMCPCSRHSFVFTVRAAIFAIELLRVQHNSFGWKVQGAHQESGPSSYASTRCMYLQT